ncbi:OmpA family protein [Tropicimonas sp. IMCC34043]|uniref:OmpA family protein n=1 Tax=Tropicimonas sp. IMCC34043 TaxID=2248760 RepID=UPI000E265344|nr:OmpA family protein [Tropicimonas sp. IMCC34043]
MFLRPSVAIALCGAIGLTACTSPNNLGSNNRNTASGAVIGGLTGAVAGLAATGGEARGAALGATLGAGVGGIIGSQMDRQAAALRQSVGDSRITIERQGDVLLVRMPQDILFSSSSYSVNPAIQADLAALAANLNQYPNTTAVVTGHTDNTGSATSNQQLSLRRAQSVVEILVSNGVARSRLTATGRGEDAPIASNLTPEGRALNRRVDIVIRPNG